MQRQPHVEVELKLRVPSDQVDDVAAALRAPGDSPAATDIELVATYHDTDDWHLLRAGFTWRMRREGTKWVQTLKAAISDDDTSRFEHEIDMGPAVDDIPPPVDASLHDVTDIGSRFIATINRLEAAGTPPSAQFRVLVHRLERTVTNEFGTVTVAFDRGWIIVAPTDESLDLQALHTIEDVGMSHAVCEVEFELVVGSVRAVHAEAALWTRRHGLVADIPNKARRGRALADALRSLLPVVGTSTPDR